MRKSTLGAFLMLFCLISAPLAAQNSSAAIENQLNDLVEKEQLLVQDVAWMLTSESTSRTSGIHHIYFKQTLNDLEIYGTDSGIHILPDGKIISQDNKFFSNTQEKISGASMPTLSAVQAVQAAA